MRVPFADRPILRILGLVLLAALGLAGGAAAQSASDASPTVVSKSVSVGADAAVLALEFEGGRTFEIGLRNGRVEVDGERVGDYSPAGPAWEAWRGLLGFAVALDNGPLARTLVEWSPPEELRGEDLEVARLLDRRLDEALAVSSPPTGDTPDVPATPSPPAGTAVGGATEEARALTALLDRRDRLPGLAEALEGLEFDDLSLTVGEDRVVGRDVQLDGTLVVVDGRLELDGEVRGDVAVVGGDVRLGPDARIAGDLRLSDGELDRRGGTIEGSVRIIDAAPEGSVDLDELRDEIREEIRSEIRAATRRDRGGVDLGPLGKVFSAIGGILANLVSILVLGVVAALVTHFAGPNLDAVAETARRTPGRALAVGTAGSFLLLPVWVIGVLVLAVSIIGIPALILWIPLFPAAAVVAGGLGYLAVARNVGVWLTRQDYPYTGWVRITNPVTLVMGGALVLSLGFIAANLLEVLPFTGALGVLFAVSSTLLTAVAVLIGFGAVLLTRAGRRPEFRVDDLFGGPGAWAHGDPADPATDPWTGVAGDAAAPAAGGTRHAGSHENAAHGTEEQARTEDEGHTDHEHGGGDAPEGGNARDRGPAETTGPGDGAEEDTTDGDAAHGPGAGPDDESTPSREGEDDDDEGSSDDEDRRA
jgi:hypothetical protein